MLVVFVVGLCAGLFIGVAAGGIIYVSAYRHVKAMAHEDRVEHKKRLEELSKWVDRSMDATRKELGLSPRRSE